MSTLGDPSPGQRSIVGAIEPILDAVIRSGHCKQPSEIPVADRIAQFRLFAQDASLPESFRAGFAATADVFAFLSTRGECRAVEDALMRVATREIDTDLVRS